MPSTPWSSSDDERVLASVDTERPPSVASFGEEPGSGVSASALSGVLSAVSPTGEPAASSAPTASTARGPALAAAPPTAVGAAGSKPAGATGVGIASPRGLRAAPPAAAKLPPLAPPPRRGSDPDAAVRRAVPTSAFGAVEADVPGGPSGLSPTSPVTFGAPPTSPSPGASGASSGAPLGTRVGMAPPQASTQVQGSGNVGRLTRRCTACGERYPTDFLVCPRDATPLVDDEGAAVDPLLGKLIGETYQIVRVVGEGGMGRVYEAKHLRLKERRFAVKTLHADLARNPEMAARFLREAESSSSINHPNVIDVFDVHHLSDGTPYFVGEFLEGEELADFVAKRGPLASRVAADLTRQVCSALAAAHARGIIHRDMKPENIFVMKPSIDAFTTGQGKTLAVKVLDFGISKAGGEGDAHLTKTGVIMGTPSYMAPEQARGKKVDHRADVYSLGACLYFMVTGRRPFDSDDPTSTLSMVLTQDPVRPREIDATVPESLELVIQRAMAKDVRDRFGSMDELDKALSAFLAPMRTLSSQSMLPVALDAEHKPQSHADIVIDVAKAMLGGGSVPPAAAGSGDLARAARPTIVVASGALGGWLVGGTVAALAGLVRVLHDGEVTLTESVLLIVGCLFAAATPAALYVLHVKRAIWPNSVRALQLATDLRRTASAALVTYGVGTIVSRIAYTVLFRSSKSIASGAWDIVLFVLSLVVAITIGGVGPLLRNLRRRSQT